MPPPSRRSDPQRGRPPRDVPASSPPTAASGESRCRWRAGTGAGTDIHEHPRDEPSPEASRRSPGDAARSSARLRSTPSCTDARESRRPRPTELATHGGGPRCPHLFAAVPRPSAHHACSWARGVPSTPLDPPHSGLKYHTFHALRSSNEQHRISSPRLSRWRTSDKARRSREVLLEPLDRQPPCSDPRAREMLRRERPAPIRRRLRPPHGRRTRACLVRERSSPTAKSPQ